MSQENISHLTPEEIETLMHHMEQEGKRKPFGFEDGYAYEGTLTIFDKEKDFLLLFFGDDGDQSGHVRLVNINGTFPGTNVMRPGHIQIEIYTNGDEITTEITNPISTEVTDPIYGDDEEHRKWEEARAEKEAEIVITMRDAVAHIREENARAEAHASAAPAPGN